MKERPVDIVLVEDNPYDAELAVIVLKRQNAMNSVEIIGDGEEALKYFAGRGDEDGPPCPNLIILDLKLPKVNGFQILQQIKSNERTKGIPVVVFTSSDEERDRVEAIRLGADRYIVKPVDFDDFSRVVAEIGEMGE